MHLVYTCTCMFTHLVDVVCVSISSSSSVILNSSRTLSPLSLSRHTYTQHPGINDTHQRPQTPLTYLCIIHNCAMQSTHLLSPPPSLSLSLSLYMCVCIYYVLPQTVYCKCMCKGHILYSTKDITQKDACKENKAMPNHEICHSMYIHVCYFNTCTYAHMHMIV